MPEDTNPEDATVDPATGRITIHRAGTYRITAPLVNAEPTRGYRTSRAGLEAYLSLVSAGPLSPARVDEAIEEAVRRGWLVPEEIEMDDAWSPDGEINRLDEGAEQKDARIAALEAALHALVDGTDPAVGAAEFVDLVRPGSAVYCFFCDKESTVGTMQPLTHAPDCPWVVARALLAEKGEE